jgi:endonuclease YncB( thermonuclease family)
MASKWGMRHRQSIGLGRILPCSMVVIALFPAVALAQRVTKVSSGDTVEIDGVGKVRLLGVRSDDPSAVRLGSRTTPSSPADGRPPTPPAIAGTVNLKPDRPSRTFLQKLVLGKTVRIQYDSLAGGKERAYLFLEDGTLINAALLRTGHARVDLSRPFAHEAEFTRLEDQARRAELGIWIQQKR